MDVNQVAQELAEELRTNTKLRHRLGMEEGSESGLLEGSTEIISFDTKEGDTFFLEVSE